MYCYNDMLFALCRLVQAYFIGDMPPIIAAGYRQLAEIWDSNGARIPNAFLLADYMLNKPPVDREHRYSTTLTVQDEDVPVLVGLNPEGS